MTRLFVMHSLWGSTSTTVNIPKCQKLHFATEMTIKRTPVPNLMRSLLCDAVIQSSVRERKGYQLPRMCPEAPPKCTCARWSQASWRGLVTFWAIEKWCNSMHHQTRRVPTVQKQKWCTRASIISQLQKRGVICLVCPSHTKPSASLRTLELNRQDYRGATPFLRSVPACTHLSLMTTVEFFVLFYFGSIIFSSTSVRAFFKLLWLVPPGFVTRIFKKLYFVNKKWNSQNHQRPYN